MTIRRPGERIPERHRRESTQGFIFIFVGKGLVEVYVNSPPLEHAVDDPS